MLINKVIDIFIGDIPPEQRASFVRIVFRGIFLFHIAWACGWVPGMQGFALASELERQNKELTTQVATATQKYDELKLQIGRGNKIQIRTAYEAELRRLNQEIFEIEARISQLALTGQRPDRIYHQRLNTLHEERTRVEQKLNAFMNANPEIIGATF